MLSVPVYPLTVLFIDEAMSRILLISIVPAFEDLVKSKNPLFDSVPFKSKNKLIAALPELQPK